MRQRQKILSGITVCIMLLFLCVIHSYSETLFEIKRIGNINPYADNRFQVITSQNGMLTIRIHDTICTYRTLTQEIEAGETIIHWDGCGYNQEKLYEKTYIISACFVTDNGKEQTISFNSPVEYPAQYLTYALPSSDVLYLDQQDHWFLEYCTVRDGTVRMDLTAEGETSPFFSYSLSTTGGKILRKDFATVSGKKKPDPGQYSVTVYETTRPEDIRTFPLTVTEHQDDPLPVSVTGNIMPDRSMPDEKIWEMMMQPSVVIDIDFFKHQDIYSEPDAESRTLGTLHGQTQGVEVIRIDNEWALIGAWNHEDAAYTEGWVPLSVLKVETPRQEYGILIDKQKQTMSVYHYGKLIDTLLVSTGKAEKNRLYQETSAGCFLTGYHRVNFSMNGKKYDYVIQYDGGNLLHQTPYHWGQNKKDFTLGRGYLGAKASHACVRIQAEPGEGGLNAYWLFTHIPYHTRVIILDDPDEREGVTAFLQRNEKSMPDESLIHVEKSNDLKDESTVRITFGGCIVPGGSNSFNQKKNSFSSFTAENGYDIPFQNVRSIFEKDDLTCISLSCLFRDKTAATPEDSKSVVAPAGTEKILEHSSVEMIQMTDERLGATDSEAYQHTLSVLKIYTGVLQRNEPLTISLKGHLFGFGGCNESDYLKNPQIIDRLAEELMERHCEKIIFLLNWGEDRAPLHSVVQEAMAHRCIRNGADLVVGNNQSTVQGIDYIEGIPVIYSTGILLDGSTSVMPKKQQGFLLQVSFGFGNENGPESVEVIPIQPYGNSAEKKNMYCPATVLSEEEFRQTVRTIWQDTADHILNRLSFINFNE